MERRELVLRALGYIYIYMYMYICIYLSILPTYIYIYITYVWKCKFGLQRNKSRESLVLNEAEEAGAMLAYRRCCVFGLRAESSACTISIWRVQVQPGRGGWGGLASGFNLNLGLQVDMCCIAVSPPPFRARVGSRECLDHRTKAGGLAGTKYY